MPRKRSKGNWLSNIPPHIGHYLAGFADGEGSFFVTLKKRADHTLGWQVTLIFNVSQRDKTVLALFKRHLGCGTLYQRKDGVWYYYVSNFTAIKEQVIPFFKKYGFLSASKKKNFSIFVKIADILSKSEEITPKELEEIIKLREKINEGRGRKRTYELEDYKNYLAENPQRLYAGITPRRKRQKRDKR